MLENLNISAMSATFKLCLVWCFTKYHIAINGWQVKGKNRHFWKFPKFEKFRNSVTNARWPIKDSKDEDLQRECSEQLLPINEPRSSFRSIAYVTNVGYLTETVLAN